jgi:hypothetical protein
MARLQENALLFTKKHINNNLICILFLINLDKKRINN